MSIDLILILGGFLFLLAGLMGAFIPILPGPPVSFAGMLLLHFSKHLHFSTTVLVSYGIICLLITLADYLLPIWGTRLGKGSKHGIVGASLGLVIGIFFFPPLGVLIGPLAGAWLAEMVNGKKSKEAFYAAMGSFVGLLLGVLLKFVVSLAIIWHSLAALFSNFS